MIQLDSISLQTIFIFKNKPPIYLKIDLEMEKIVSEQIYTSSKETSNDKICLSAESKAPASGKLMKYSQPQQTGKEKREKFESSTSFKREYNGPAESPEK